MILAIELITRLISSGFLSCENLGWFSRKILKSLVMLASSSLLRPAFSIIVVNIHAMQYVLCQPRVLLLECELVVLHLQVPAQQFQN